MRTLEGECKEGVLHIETITRRFPTIAEMEVRTSNMQMKTRTGVVALAWNSSQEISQQQGNSCPVVDEELLLLVSISTAQNWRKSTWALCYRTCKLSNLKCSRRRLTTRNWKLSGQQREPRLSWALKKCEPAGFSFSRQWPSGRLMRFLPLTNTAHDTHISVSRLKLCRCMRCLSKLFVLAVKFWQSGRIKLKLREVP